MPRRDRALVLPAFREAQRFVQQPVANPGPFAPEAFVIPPPPTPRTGLAANYRQYVDEAALGQLFETLPEQTPPKPKPVAMPTGRQVNVRLGDLMKVYSFEMGPHKCKLVDFRVPLIGEYILTKNLAEGTKIRKCTMGNLREPRLIFEVVE